VAKKTWKLRMARRTNKRRKYSFSFFEEWGRGETYRGCKYLGETVIKKEEGTCFVNVWI
jgi:hypothetical protein